jgi:ribonuclease E
MAESTSVALAAAPIPNSADLKRAQKFVRESFLHEGEDPAVALAPGTPRRRALDGALAELAQGAKHPSTKWRRRYSLMLGLERVLSEDEPKLVDGTVLSAHQVDALSGTLTALLAEAQRAHEAQNGNGRALAEEAHELISVADTASGPMNGAAAPRTADADDELDDEDDEEGEEDEEPEGELDLDDEDDEEEEEEEEEPEDVSADADEEPQDWEEEEGEDEESLAEAPEDPNAAKRFWFEHATGAGKTVAALGFVEASQTGGILILTHRRNLVDQFLGELKDRGYSKRISRPLYVGEDATNAGGWGPVTVETYQWFVRNAGRISSAYTIVICDEAHTALGDKTSAAIRDWTGPIFIGMTATGALIARHVTDLFPTQTSRFDLAQAARRGVIAPLRCVRIPPGVGVRTIAKVPLRRGEVDTEFDQEELAELLDQQPFNLAAANLYKTRFNNVPGVVYAAGVKHAYNLAEAFRAEGIKAQAVSGETPKRELASILARYENGDIDVLINAQLLAEGWNSPRATLCMHLAPTASRRIYQQRVGRVTRRHPGKEAGIVVDFVHPATKHDDPVVTLHSLLDRDVYRGGAIVVGPVRRGRGRRMRVERRVLPVCADEERRFQVFERELWRIAVENLDWGEQHLWAALAGARVQTGGWRKARAMLHFDKSGELKGRFLITAVQRNKNAQLRLRALTDVAALRNAETFDTAVDIVGGWQREERREGVKILLRALAEKRIGRRDQANAWTWRMAEYTREIHEEYAVQRWPETKRLLGLLVNSSGAAHARNARKLVQASRKQDRRLAAALLAAALAHTPEAEEVLRGARTRMSRKPQALARELLRNFPKRRGKSARRKRRRDGAEGAAGAAGADGAAGAVGAERVAVAAGADGAEGAAGADGAARAAAAAAGAADGARITDGSTPDRDVEETANASAAPADGDRGAEPTDADAKSAKPPARRSRRRARPKAAAARADESEANAEQQLALLEPATEPAEEPAAAASEESPAQGPAKLKTRASTRRPSTAATKAKATKAGAASTRSKAPAASTAASTVRKSPARKAPARKVAATAKTEPAKADTADADSAAPAKSAAATRTRAA